MEPRTASSDPVPPGLQQHPNAMLLGLPCAHCKGYFAADLTRKLYWAELSELVSAVLEEPPAWAKDEGSRPLFQLKEVCTVCGCKERVVMGKRVAKVVVV
jgi:hypothetical protein